MTCLKNPTIIALNNIHSAGLCDSEDETVKTASVPRLCTKSCWYTRSPVTSVDPAILEPDPPIVEENGSEYEGDYGRQGRQALFRS